MWGILRATSEFEQWWCAIVVASVIWKVVFQTLVGFVTLIRGEIAVIESDNSCAPEISHDVPESGLYMRKSVK